MHNTNTVPRHVGIILDGNRRWAKKRGISTQAGHKAGFKTFRTIADASLERGIAYLTVYAFSTENWHRAKDEVTFLIAYAQIVIKKYISELNKKNVRFMWLGSEHDLPIALIKSLRTAEEKTKQNTAGTLCVCFNYGGQQAIADAAANLALLGKPMTVQGITEHMYGAENVPPIDLLIRTSGEKRISNFMLWRAAYSELYFTDVLWPDFTPADLDNALIDFANRKRRYGA